jgi:hypothetical protein
MSTTLVCLRCHDSYLVDTKQESFLERAAPQAEGATLTFSMPRFCPSCRDQGRLAWRNDRALYMRECGMCQRRIVSCYSPQSEIQVLCANCWNSDRWDPMSFGQEFDSSKSFLEQFQCLFKRVPHLALYNLDPENSDYCNHAAGMKDCYCVFASAMNERTLYATRTWKNTNCMDLLESSESENCYMILDCHNCYQLLYSEHCTHCADSAFLFDCHSCRSCFGSANLRQREYVFFNQQLSKAAYEAELAKLALNSHSGVAAVRAAVDRHLQQQVHRHAFLTGCEDCIGDQLVRCKQSRYCFNLSEAEDCHYCELGFSPKDSYDASGISQGELCYGIVNHLGSSRCSANVITYYNDNCHYAYHCQSCSDSLGVVGLRHKQHVILNRQYSKSEYQVLLGEIARQMSQQNIWGEFFPGWLSPFGYNETEAQSIYPRSQLQAANDGFRWSCYENPRPHTATTLHATELPDTISQVSDQILGTVILCRDTGKPFKIGRAELAFYRKHNVPVPQLHPDARYRALLARRNSRRMYPRQCSYCPQKFVSAYPPQSASAVLCEACYRKEIFG